MAGLGLSSNVYVEITEQPMGKGLRFRYISEGRTAGSIQGEHSTNEHRTFPSIKIHNYSGPAMAVVTCVTTDRPARPHPHHLVGTNCVKGICRVQISGSNEPIPFANIGIQCCTRKDIGRNLQERMSLNVDPFNTGQQMNFDSIDLTTVCLCFQVYANVNGTFVPLNPVVSNPIVDKKVCSELSVVRLSRISGSVRGGDEVFLLCSKIKKEDIKVIFSHRLENGEAWEKEGSFSSTDVHKQYVVVFKTPPYHEVDIKRPVDVCLYLMRPSDNAIGEAKTFTYYPENPDPFGIKAKRKRLAQTSVPYFMSSFDISSGLENRLTKPQAGLFQPIAGLSNDPGQWNFADFHAPATQTVPKIKHEMPVQQAGMNFYQPSAAASMTNPYTFTGIPASVAEAALGSDQMLQSASVSKKFGAYKASSSFLRNVSSPSSSALELLVASSSKTASKSGSAATNVVNSSLNYPNFYFASPNSTAPNSTAPESNFQPQNNVGLPAAAAAAAASNLEFTISDLESTVLSSNFSDDAAIPDVLNDDLFKSLMTSDEQRFMFSGVGTDLPELTDEEMKCFSEFFE